VSLLRRREISGVKVDKLRESEKINVPEILKNLESYRPKRKGWTWRKKLPPGAQVGDFKYNQISVPVLQGAGLPAAKHFDGIDPQPDCVITTEIASGRFEDDLRRMRMAVYHGADHIMVIRTAGQSHIDGLMEGTPEGVGGVPITRKQVRATRKALDLFEEEVGRPINFHSYVSGIAGPEIAVLFAEEGVNGAHQDPQYNVLYRNINMVRSFVDAAEAKILMAHADMLQIDGAHNANATARFAWKVTPELLVQHAINCAYSLKVGMKKENIALSTVPPTAPPAPCIRMDLPFAVALRDLFKGFKFRAQMNTRYMGSCFRENTVTHALNVLISRLTCADIQSTITPDEGRNVPWHYNNIHGVNTAKQALIGLDGITDMVELKKDGLLGEKVREIKERAVLFIEEMVELGGYFNSVEKGFFVDSGYYPEGVGDGVERFMNEGQGTGSCVERDEDYFAPVCAHFGYNNVPADLKKPCDMIGGCTLCDLDKIVYIDELDEDDNVEKRLERTKFYREKDLIRPEVEFAGDGIINISVFFPTDESTAKCAATEMAQRFGLEDVQVIHKQVMHPAEGTYCEVRGRVMFDIKKSELNVPVSEPNLDPSYIRQKVRELGLKTVAATVGEDEHSVGIREILDIKHGGLEAFGFKNKYLGTSVPVEKILDAAVEYDADVVLTSTIITHKDIHRINMRRMNNIAIEKGVRKRMLLICGGTQINDDMAKEEGLDAGFGRGTKGIDVATFIVREMEKRR